MYTLNTENVLQFATKHLYSLIGYTFEVINISKPTNKDYAKFLSKIISKLSPIVGNMIEEQMSTHLNTIKELQEYGTWVRQDPGFPDNIFYSDILNQTPGIEIKAWLPLATEITARFKTNQTLLQNNNTLLALVVWMPEFILYGRPKIIDIWIGTAKSIAEARDNHYFNPPRYLIIEPQNTANRTVNLQQQNVEGYILQSDINKVNKYFSKQEIVDFTYSPNNTSLKQIITNLRNTFDYRMDTNFSKLDRLGHEGINNFKTQIFDSELFNTGYTIKF